MMTNMSGDVSMVSPSAVNRSAKNRKTNSRTNLSTMDLHPAPDLLEYDMDLPDDDDDKVTAGKMKTTSSATGGSPSETTESFSHSSSSMSTTLSIDESAPESAKSMMLRQYQNRSNRNSNRNTSSSRRSPTTATTSSSSSSSGEEEEDLAVAPAGAGTGSPTKTKTVIANLSDHNGQALLNHLSGHGQDGALVGEDDEEELNSIHPDDDPESFVGDEEDDSTGHGSSLTGEHQLKQKRTRAGLTPEETRAVRRLRFLLIFVLLCVTTVMCVLVWWYLSGVEQQEFEVGFQTQGTKLVSGFQDDSFQKMQALDTLSRSVTNYAEQMPSAATAGGSSSSASSTAPWPFVTIENSHEFFTPYLSMANAAAIAVTPVVSARQRLAWEEYAADKQDWIEQDLATQRRLLQDEMVNTDGNNELASIKEEEEEEDRRHRSLADHHGSDHDTISRYIKNYVGIDTSPTRWMPSWQYAPAIDNKWFINFNQLADESYYRDVTTSVLDRGQSVISATKTFVPGLDVQSLNDFIFTQDLLAAGDFGVYQEGEPIGYIHYPVFADRTKNTTTATGTATTVDSPTVAVITATVYWKTFFQNILPDDAEGIVCVVENDEQSFTYIINGKDAIYQGMEDLHDPQFDELAIVAEYKSFELDSGAAAASRYVGVPVNDETPTGGYRIYVYPSVTFQQSYKSSDPIVFAIVVLGMMLIAISIFIAYDCYVERRQKKVSGVAENQDAIITSLFPEKVRDQLYNRQQEEAAAANVKNPLKPSKKKSVGFNAPFVSEEKKAEVDEFGDDIMKHPMQESASGQALVGGTSSALNITDQSEPIAERYPACTVLFMDIAGFTQWSSTREPSEVFILLETIYRAFDIIAKKRKVFKVETIGDCYLAVCGLPEPCETHALNMAKFARDSLQKMVSLTRTLQAKLGEDTGNLHMRVGLHSGPVTAGVLRGDRARFQLFGDTVNTAARMESNGMKGRIHISSETAALLTEKHDLGHLIAKRTDKIHAKGKGELQTYWLASKTTSTSASRAGSKAGSRVTRSIQSSATGSSLNSPSSSGRCMVDMAWFQSPDGKPKPTLDSLMD